MLACFRFSVLCRLVRGYGKRDRRGMTMKMWGADNEQGSIINVALLMLLILSVLALAVNRATMLDSAIAVNEKLDQLAIYAAEAGIERAAVLMENPSADRTWLGVEQPFGAAAYTVTITDMTGHPVGHGSSSHGSSGDHGSPAGRPADHGSPSGGFFGGSLSDHFFWQGSSSSSLSMLDEYDDDEDGYVRILATGSSRGISRKIEVFYSRDAGGRITYRMFR